MLSIGGTQRHRPAVRLGDTVRTVYELLRDLIVEGEFAPGQRLTQAELGKRLGVGRTPLREALRMLESDGLVSSGPNSGVRVARVKLNHAEDLYAVRLLLEPPMLAGVADQLTKRDMRELHSMLLGLRSLGRGYRDFHRQHLKFHMETYRSLSPAITELIEALSRRVFWLQHVYMSRVPVADDFTALDELLLKALTERDAPRIQQLHQLHMIDAAIGLLTEVDPEHRFDCLLKTASSIGIEIDTSPDGKIEPPATVRFVCAKSTLTFETQHVRVTNS